MHMFRALVFALFLLVIEALVAKWIGRLKTWIVIGSFGYPFCKMTATTKLRIFEKHRGATEQEQTSLSFGCNTPGELGSIKMDHRFSEIEESWYSLIPMPKSKTRLAWISIGQLGQPANKAEAQNVNSGRNTIAQKLCLRSGGTLRADTQWFRLESSFPLSGAKKQTGPNAFSSCSHTETKRERKKTYVEHTRNFIVDPPV